MSSEADNKMEVDEEAVTATARQVSSESYKEQYRQLKSKLKYLVYVRKSDANLIYSSDVSVSRRVCVSVRCVSCFLT